MSNRKGSSTSEIREKIEALAEVTTRPMFGYQCYSVNGKFFAGFGKKDKSNTMMIVRLPKELQPEALKDKRLNIKPFSHGAKMGWVEIDTKSVSKIEEAFYWVKKGYEHALSLSKTNDLKQTPRHS